MTESTADDLLHSLYDRIKKNQKCWSPTSEIFKTQSLFVIALVDAINKLQCFSVVEANAQQLLGFLDALISSGFKDMEKLCALLKCSKKSEHYENWTNYKYEFCCDWIRLLTFISLKLSNAMNAEERNVEAVVNMSDNLTQFLRIDEGDLKNKINLEKDCK